MSTYIIRKKLLRDLSLIDIDDVSLLLRAPLMAIVGVENFNYKKINRSLAHYGLIHVIFLWSPIFGWDIWSCYITNDIGKVVLVNFHQKTVFIGAFLTYRCVNQTSKLECARILARERSKIHTGTVYQIMPQWNRKHFINDNFVKSTENTIKSSQIRLCFIRVTYWCENKSVA